MADALCADFPTKTQLPIYKLELIPAAMWSYYFKGTLSKESCSMLGAKQGCCNKSVLPPSWQGKGVSCSGQDSLSTQSLHTSSSVQSISVNPASASALYTSTRAQICPLLAITGSLTIVLNTHTVIYAGLPKVSHSQLLTPKTFLHDPKCTVL